MPATGQVRPLCKCSTTQTCLGSDDVICPVVAEPFESEDPHAMIVSRIRDTKLTGLVSDNS